MQLKRNGKHNEKLSKRSTSVTTNLFGGFTFDPQNNVDGEWTDFPEAYFALATFQLVIRDDKAYVSIHLLTQDQQAEDQFEALRKERDHLIHALRLKK